MLRPAFRPSALARAIAKPQTGKRCASTSARSGTWKGSALRWAAAGALVYYYNTSSVFAEEPSYATRAPSEKAQESETYQSIHSIAEQRRAQARSSLQQSQSQNRTIVPDSTSSEPAEVVAGGAGDLEEEAEQQGAFNEETGEINWDCPCLGGMAHGPCGEQFRAAFSCFVFSKEEPKGVECIEHFKTMQNCFREHPEMYGSELDEEAVDEQLDTQSLPEDATLSHEPQVESTPERAPSAERTQAKESSTTHHNTRSASEPVKAQQILIDEADTLVPRAWHDGRESSSRPTEK